MALPKLDTPTYSLVLPSTGQEIKYRPFLVKEQKLLMMAQESKEQTNISETMSNVISSCTFNNINPNQIPLFDIEYIFLKIRSKSVGETQEIRVLCPDDGETYGNVTLNLDEIEVQMTEGHTNEINLTDKIKIIMKYPQLKDMRGLDSIDTVQTEQIFSIMKYCIWEVHDGDKVYNRVDISDKDIEEFIDSFDNQQLELILNFFQTMPKIRHPVKVINPKTKVESELVLEGLESFLE
tara:strand:+ start:1334 stop:2044 length:711 start_codon:yes stop_codon:yes gene_type:complete